MRLKHLILYKHLMNKIKKRKNILAIGGGHGLGRVLAALSHLDNPITGIVTTTDNGGSTGRIRACQGGIAWGDTRNCINQLITEPSIGSLLFEYRFKGNGDLHNHNLGNLILTALNNLSVRPLDAINLIRDLLKISVKIIPMSEDPADLKAQLTNGRIISGETDIDELDEITEHLIIDPPVKATKEGVCAIEEADLILIGPGSFLTSIMPPLLLVEISQALYKNKTAKLVFIRNLKEEKGPARFMSLNNMLSWCESAMFQRPIDIVLGPDRDENLPKRYHQLVKNLASVKSPWRHDREALLLVFKEILSEG